MDATPVRVELGLKGVPDSVRGLIETLEAAGHPSFVVGGSVRDLLLRRRPGDFDVATAAPVETLLTLFPRAIPIGLQHGTVMVPTVDGPVDVTHFRGGTLLEDDLARRDFTINAMAWHPTRGELFDPHLHEAVAAHSDPDVPEGHVVQVLQVGLTLAVGRLVRPARVIVSG